MADAKRKVEFAKAAVLLKEGEARLEQLDFEDMFNKVLDNEIRLENANTNVVTDGLPLYLAKLVQDKGYELEVYEKTGETYKNILPSKLESTTKIRSLVLL